MDSYALLWLKAFCLTQLIEVPIYAIALKKRWILGFGASMLTHPIVWFVIPFLWDWKAYSHFLIVAEGFAVVAEFFYLHLLKVPKPWLWSLIANAASAGFGLFFSRYFF